MRNPDMRDTGKSQEAFDIKKKKGQTDGPKIK